jgi:hypothetical protein
MKSEFRGNDRSPEGRDASGSAARAQESVTRPVEGAARPIPKVKRYALCDGRIDMLQPRHRPAPVIIRIDTS